MIRRLVVVALVAAALLTGTPAAASEEQRAAPGLVLGDSLTYAAQRDLQGLRPAWVIDGRRGRHVETLIPLLRQYLAVNPAPRRVVFSLGTNENGHYRNLYRDAVALLPENTSVTLVTTYRDRRVFGRHRARLAVKISRWMRETAAERDQSCVAEWRGRVLAEPRLLRDGVHQTQDRGARVWAKMIARTATRCGRR